MGAEASWVRALQVAARRMSEAGLARFPNGRLSTVFGVWTFFRPNGEDRTAQANWPKKDSSETALTRRNQLGFPRASHYRR